MTNHLGKHRFVYFQAIASQHIGRQGRTFFLTNRRQLCRITDEHQPASLPGIDILNKVIKQPARTEHGTRQTIVGYHRRFIYNEKGMLMQIVVDGKVIDFIGKALLSIDFLMNGVSGMTCIMSKDFGCSPRRCQKHTLLFQAVERLHQRPNQGGLSRTCIAF